ncbi:MAG TPA: class I SAM-dependent methyltransferase [Phycisphaerae bacterium]|nr:class I SAM-dependent methyltransferase [Phycisphaerae bacterium]
MTTFQDLFSKQAACYAQCRPHYPRDLLAYLAGLANERKLAWDVGTGNGQAAVGLAEHFDRVIATDGSAEQIAHASPHGRVEYHVALAEEAGPTEGLNDASVNLVTVAQALHWFATEAFFANVRRVLKQGGIIAAWCYGIHCVNPAIDAISGRFYHEITGPYWPEGREYIDEKYETIPFPFEEVKQSRDRKGAVGAERENGAASEANHPHPATLPSNERETAFECRESWNVAQYVGYLHSWSAVQRFKEAKGYDPLDEIADDLAVAWGDPETHRVVTWPIHLRLGQLHSALELEQ